jgi:Maltokinase N-terminal cap domain
MSIIHRTTLEPSKLELLASWLPAQSWYLGEGSEPVLAKAGGFRLDDPRGEVGIEFMAVSDASGGSTVTYHVPVTYRGAPLEGAEDALVGTSEHGVLGRRWVYDGAHDPVLVTQLFALVVGAAEPQAQSTSNSPDPSVTGCFAETGGAAASVGIVGVEDGAHGTEIRVLALSSAGSPDGPGRPLTIQVNRVLRPQQTNSPAHPEELGHVTADWSRQDGGKERGRYAVVRGAALGR